MQPAPTAVMQQWYSLVREKRTQRQDFLKALVKVFDVEMTATSQVSYSRPPPRTWLKSVLQDDVEFARYMAENFACFEYKTQEEVLTVIKYLTGILSTTGMQLVELFCPQQLLAQLHDGNPPMSQDNPTETEMMLDAAPAPVPAPVLVPVPPPVPTETRPDITSNLAYSRSSVIVAVLMVLKAYLKSLYSVSEE